MFKKKYNIIDITIPCGIDFNPYKKLLELPNDKVEKIRSIDTNGWDAYSINLTSLSGTYLETGAHLYSEYLSLYDFPISRFCVDVLIVDVSPKNPLEHIERSELKHYASKLNPRMGFIVYTGWDSKRGESIYFEKSPHFSIEAMEWIIQQKINILGGDMPSFDDPLKPFGFLKSFFRGGKRLLLAPLKNLNFKKPIKATLMVLPLLIPKVCGAPCRAILIVEEKTSKYGGK